MIKESITLLINGKPVTYFTPDFSPASLYRKMVSTVEDFDEDHDAIKWYERLLDLLCSVYGNQFTPSDVESGLSVHELMPEVEKAYVYIKSKNYRTDKTFRLK